MTLNSASHGKQSQHHHKSRLAPHLSSTVTPAAAQCEVAFPGNRIFSPSPTDEVRRKADHSIDIHQTTVNDSASREHQPSTEDLPSQDSDVSGNVSSQLASNSCNADTSIAASSDHVNSLTAAAAEFGKESEIVEKTDDVENAVNHHGIYVENGNAADAVPLEPMKAEKLATFGECIIVLIHCY